VKSISADNVRAWLVEGEEFAFVDVREPGQYGEDHLLHPVNIPYSRLELDAPALIPRPDVPICLVDDDGELAARAAGRLEALGYTDVRCIDGGMKACVAAGFTALKGVNVPSKLLGELAEHTAHTPAIDAEELKAMIDAGEDFVVLDGRSPQEFKKMSIPTASSCPNAELPYRLPTLVPDPDKKIIVNCAGRTRSIIGVENLRNAGFTNPIFALRNGTQGWRLNGFELDFGKEPAQMPELDDAAVAAAQERAAAMMSKFDLPTVDAETFSEWVLDKTRTLYLVDIRTAEEYAAGHLEGAVHVAGGQFVQQTDATVAVRGSWVVLCDDNKLRAATTAYWLKAMKHDVYILDVDASNPPKDLPAVKSAVPAFSGSLTETSADKLDGKTIVDLRSSGAYRDGHIDGAVWSIRPLLSSLGLKADSEVVLVAGNKGVAELAAIDLRESGVTRLSYLPGGSDAWKAAGLTITATPDVPADDARIDFLFFVHDRHDGNLESSREYLRWEMGLVDQVQDWEMGLFALS